MSDVIRDYNRPAHLRHTRRHWGRIPWMALLGALLALCVAFLWTTRDAYEMRECIPSDQAYHVVALDLLQQRGALAAARFWELLPPDANAAEIRDQLGKSFGLPEWVLNNIVSRVVYVSGNDTKTFSDPLIVTKMSRIGAFAERFHRFGGVVNDYAGGLDLRTIPDAGLHYAVRGRVLAVSPSRDALTRALSRSRDEVLSEEAYTRDLEDAAGERLSGALALAPDTEPGKVFDAARFTLGFEGDELRLTVQGQLRPEWRDRLAGVLGAAHPVTLDMPEDGLLECSANLGKPLEQLIPALAESAGMTEQVAPFLARLADPAERAANPMIALGGALLDACGKSLRLSCVGVDQNEIAPLPLLVVQAEADAARVTEAFEAIPPLPEGVKPWDIFPQYNPEKHLAFLPLPGGPNLEPTAALRGGALMISTSRSIADMLLAQPAAAATVKQEGNLYCRLHPAVAVKEIAQAGHQLAAVGLLRGYTVESFDTAAAAWTAQADAVAEVAALAAHDNGTIRLALRVLMAPPPAKT